MSSDVVCKECGEEFDTRRLYCPACGPEPEIERLRQERDELKERLDNQKVAYKTPEEPEQ